ncbi:AI-2E family transporter [Halodurantibacterium flavum]|uniref:AI-2E family transporter n=1 Tax=Halodurantibacterium flavum TaxID=1382802 RepID=A0ABW4S301_9RHOB
MNLPLAARYANIVLATIALFVALSLGRSVFAPFALAIVVGIVLSPVASLINRLGLPRALGAFLGLGLILTILGGMIILLEPLVSLALEQAPRLWQELSDIITSLQRGLADLDSVSDEIARAFQPDEPAADGEEEAPTFMLPRLSDALFLAPAVASQILIFIGALFFFLLSRTDIYEWAGRISNLPDLRAARLPAGFTGPLHLRLMRAEKQVSRYFLTITVINTIFGAIVAGAFMLAGIPSALMWGVIAFLLNFIPYLGPLILAGTLLLSGLVMYEGALRFMPVALYMGLNFLEGQFITPAMVGQHLQVNALAVFLSLVFWLWLWGPLGGFVAIPLLVWFVALSKADPVPENQPAPAEIA